MDPLQGRILGPYQLGERLGGGGMGSVYRAQHSHLSQARAIKLLSPQLIHEERFVHLFYREARLAARLRHDNIVQIYDIAEDEGTPYIVMELLEGRPLRDVIRDDRPVPFERVVHLVGQLASALEYAHRNGVAHRDVKPLNVFVSADDHVTLVDFGIARAADASRMTMSYGLGTPAYMAPERFDEDLARPGADAHTLGVDADLYAIGVVAYELIAGEQPFRGKTREALIFERLDRDPEPIGASRSGVPEDVELVVLRQLSRDPRERLPAARFATALADGLRIEQLLADVSTAIARGQFEEANALLAEADATGLRPRAVEALRKGIAARTSAPTHRATAIDLLARGDWRAALEEIRWLEEHGAPNIQPLVERANALHWAELSRLHVERGVVAGDSPAGPLPARPNPTGPPPGGAYPGQPFAGGPPGGRPPAVGPHTPPPHSRAPAGGQPGPWQSQPIAYQPGASSYPPGAQGWQPDPYASGRQQAVRRNRARRGPPTVLVALGILLAIAAIAATVVLLLFELPLMQVTITPQTRALQQDLEIVVDPAAAEADPGRRLLPGAILQQRVEVVGALPSSGSRKVGVERARGEVMFISQSNQPITIPRGTPIFSTRNRIEFTTDREVRVPALSLGTARVGITAVQPGASGNQDAGAITVLDARQFGNVFPRNDRPTTGGADRDGRVVTAADVTRLREQLQARAREQAVAELTERAGRDRSLIEESIRLEPEGEAFEPAVDAEAEQVTGRYVLVARALTFANDDLTSLAEQLLLADAGPDFDWITGQLILGAPHTLAVDGDAVRIQTQARANVARRIDGDDLVERLRWKSADEARTVLARLDGLAGEPRIEAPTPDWPLGAYRVEVTIQPAP